MSTYETERDEAAEAYCDQPRCAQLNRDDKAWHRAKAAWLDGADWAWAKAQGELAEHRATIDQAADRIESLNRKWSKADQAAITARAEAEQYRKWSDQSLAKAHEREAELAECRQEWSECTERGVNLRADWLEARATADAMMGDAMCARAEVSRMSELVTQLTNKKNTLIFEVERLQTQVIIQAKTIKTCLNNNDLFEAQVRKLEGELKSGTDFCEEMRRNAIAYGKERDQWRDRALKAKAALERIALGQSFEHGSFYEDVARGALAEFEAGLTPSTS